MTRRISTSLVSSLPGGCRTRSLPKQSSVLTALGLCSASAVFRKPRDTPRAAPPVIHLGHRSHHLHCADKLPVCDLECSASRSRLRGRGAWLRGCRSATHTCVVFGSCARYWERRRVAVRAMGLTGGAAPLGRVPVSPIGRVTGQRRCPVPVTADTALKVRPSVLRVPLSAVGGGRVMCTAPRASAGPAGQLGSVLRTPFVCGSVTGRN